MTNGNSTKQNPRDKLIELIPAEIVAVYLFIQAALLDLSNLVVIIAIVILTIITWVYLRVFGEMTDPLKLAFSTIAFLVWVYATAPAELLGEFYNPALATVILAIYTLIIPLVMKRVLLT